MGASSGAQVLRTIAGIPSGPLDLEVSSWRRVWRTFTWEQWRERIANIKFLFENLLSYIEGLFRRGFIEAFASLWGLHKEGLVRDSTVEWRSVFVPFFFMVLFLRYLIIDIVYDIFSCIKSYKYLRFCMWWCGWVVKSYSSEYCEVYLSGFESPRRNH